MYDLFATFHLLIAKRETSESKYRGVNGHVTMIKNPNLYSWGEGGDQTFEAGIQQKSDCITALVNIHRILLPQDIEHCRMSVNFC